MKIKKPSNIQNNLAVPDGPKVNISKLNPKSKPRKRIKNKNVKSTSKKMASLDIQTKISYLDSACGTITCVERVKPTISNKSIGNPIYQGNSTSQSSLPPGNTLVASTSSNSPKNLQSEICLKPKKGKTKGHNRQKNSSASSILKVSQDIGTKNSDVERKNTLQQLCPESMKNESEGCSFQDKPVVPDPSSSYFLKNKRLHKVTTQHVGHNLQLSSSYSENSIIKMSSTTFNNSGNVILHKLCSDTRKNDNGGFSLLESLVTGSELNEVQKKEENMQELNGLNETYSSNKNNFRKFSSEKSGMSSVPSIVNRMTTPKESTNSPLCSIVLHSNGTNSVANFYEIGSSKYIVSMSPKSNLAFVGTVELQLLKGSIEILGYNLYKEGDKLLVFSLQGSSHLCLKALESSQSDTKSTQEIYEELIALGLSDQLSHKVSKKSEKSVLITISRNKTDVSSTVWPKFFENHSSFSIFPNNILFSSNSRPCHMVERKMKCLFETNFQELGLKEFTEVPEWSETENAILVQDYPKTIICGGKSVGKSSFLRYLTNKCLYKWKQILILDFDLGQCEFTVPGCISATLVEEPLLGPNYSHLKEPQRSVFLGEVDVTKCPEQYIEGCKSLIDYAKHQHCDVPWLINTMGFTRGFGVSLACGIINYVNPAHIVQIQSKDRKLNFPSLLEPKFVNCLKHSAFDVAVNSMDYQLHVIPSGSEQAGFASRSRGMSPAESRNLVILAYVSKMLSSTTTSLSQVTPYMISMDKLYLQTTNQYNLTKSQIAAAMNGNLVAMCHKAPSNQVIDCRGFGIVRGIDWQKGTIFLITPLPVAELSRVNCLVKGNVGLPDSLYYNQGEIVTGYVPYLAHTSGGSTARFARRDFRNLPVTQRDSRQNR